MAPTFIGRGRRRAPGGSAQRGLLATGPGAAAAGPRPPAGLAADLLVAFAGRGAGPGLSGAAAPAGRVGHHAPEPGGSGSGRCMAGPAAGGGLRLRARGCRPRGDSGFPVDAPAPLPPSGRLPAWVYASEAGLLPGTGRRRGSTPGRTLDRRRPPGTGGGARTRIGEQKAEGRRQSPVGRAEHPAMIQPRSPSWPRLALLLAALAVPVLLLPSAFCLLPSAFCLSLAQAQEDDLPADPVPIRRVLLPPERLPAEMERVGQ